MAVEQEFTALVQRYVEGDCTLGDLRLWTRRHWDELAATTDPDTAKLDGTVTLLIGEYSIGHRDEASVRAALRTVMERLRTGTRRPAVVR